MSFTTLSLIAAQSVSDGLTLRNLIDSLPTDPASVFTIALLVGTALLVLWAGRPKGKGGRPA